MPAGDSKARQNRQVSISIEFCGFMRRSILFKRRSKKVKVEILLQCACDIKSWLDPFITPLVSSAHQNLTLRNHISGVWRTILICKVCAFKLKVSKYAYELKSPDILSFRSFIWSKWGTFLRHPVCSFFFLPNVK